MSLNGNEMDNCLLLCIPEISYRQVALLLSQSVYISWCAMDIAFQVKLCELYRHEVPFPLCAYWGVQ